MRELLPYVQKPARYLGREVNAIVKPWEETGAHVCLAFPDLYELGMSHPGFQILYHAFNARPDALCERAFAPAPDMEGLLRNRRVPLASVESDRPLKDFDLLGFSLSTEVNFTNLLNMLALGGVPIEARGRGEGDPIVVAGGHAVFNPEPIAPALDLCLLGDGEEAALEMAAVTAAGKRSGASRREILDALARIEGAYRPEDFEVRYRADGRIDAVVPKVAGRERIRARVVHDLSLVPYPERFVLPYMDVVHNRMAIELNKGCTQGCRYCQAGMITRPTRERSVEELVRLAEALIRSTGDDSISLLSLSAMDYSQIERLLLELTARLDPLHVSLSFPSLRVDSFEPALIEQVRGLRKSSFTIAPEAGTERLRRVINKNFSDREIVDLAALIWSLGWKTVKMYFMTGLPGEEEEDLAGIVALAAEAHRAGRRTNGRARLHVGASPFIPKPHTPFQWAPQAPLEALEEKRRFLVRGLSRTGIEFKGNDPEGNFLEGVLSRGDRRLFPAIRRAWELGARLDGWSEHLRLDLWRQAWRETGIDPDFYARRARPDDEVFPWEHLGGPDKGFLLEDAKKSRAEVTVKDCFSGVTGLGPGECHRCGVCDFRAVLPLASDGPRPRFRSGYAPEVRRSLPAREPGWSPRPLERRERPPRSKPPTAGYRLTLAKTGDARWLSTLEFHRTLARTVRRAGLPLAYSAAFHPAPELSVGQALPVGVESVCELVDLRLEATGGEVLPAETVRSILSPALPLDLRILEARPLQPGEPSAESAVEGATFEVTLPPGTGHPPGGEALPEGVVACTPQGERVWRLELRSIGGGIRLPHALETLFGVERSALGLVNVVKREVRLRAGRAGACPPPVAAVA